MFSSTQELAAKLKSVRYLVAEDMLPAIYLAVKLGRPLLIEGPPGSGKTELACAVARAAGIVVERLQCYVGINEENAIGKFDEALQRLFLETAKDAVGEGWDPFMSREDSMHIMVMSWSIVNYTYRVTISVSDTTRIGVKWKGSLLPQCASILGKINSVLLQKGLVRRLRLEVFGHDRG